MAHQFTRKDIAAIVTDKIVAMLESGVQPWKQPWASGQPGGFPRRHSGEPYRGVNVLLLWAAAYEAGHTSPYWMTYRQAQELGGQVRKGEHSELVVYYCTALREPEAGEDEAERFRFLKAYSVFNACQIDGLPDRFYTKAEAVTFDQARVPELEAIAKATGAKITIGGNRAFYRISTDSVHIPDFEKFTDAETYYAVLFHELAHWTRHKSRLDRDFGSVMHGDEGYAKEELVAELSAAFIGAELGLRPDHIDNHAAYIATWLTILKNDKRFILSAAAKAQQAAEFILQCRKIVEPVMDAA